MCPVVLLTCIYSIVLLLIELTTALTVNYSLKELRIKEGEEATINFTLVDSVHQPWIHSEYLYYQVKIGSPRVAVPIGDNLIKLDRSLLNLDDKGHFTHTGSTKVRGKLLGHTYLSVYPWFNLTTNGDGGGSNSVAALASALKDEAPCSHANASFADKLTSSKDGNNHLPVLVALKHSRLEKVFTISVVSLVLLNFINMGCAVDLVVVKSVLSKPIAPLIGFISQYVVMPLISYIVGYFLLNGDDYYYWFGLFAFGCSPGGNASNMWTLLLGGNLNLSLTMTFLSTFSALFMIPLWLFTLGVHIRGPTSFNIPYLRIIETLLAMAFFLGIGLLIQKYLPKIARICRKILAPVSTVMIIFIVVFSTYVYWSMVKLLTWKILFSAGLNVWFGFAIGFGLSFMFNFPKGDQLAIAIETGVQNTGISIMLIRLALQPPESDLATLLPVAASLMTPIPLMVLLLVRRLKDCKATQKQDYNYPNDDLVHPKHRTSPLSPENRLINSNQKVISWKIPEL